MSLLYCIEGSSAGAPSQAETARAPRILVADGDPGAGQVLAEMLGALGYEANWCGSASETLRRCRDERPDAVLTELELATDEGTPLVRALHQTQPSLSVGVLTGWLLKPPDTAALLGRLPVVAYKPVSLRELRPLAAALVGGGRARGTA